MINNVALSAILGIVLLGTLYPLLTEALGFRVSVGPPYFNPVGAIFFLPAMTVLAVGPLLRWRRDSLGRIRPQLLAIGGVFAAALLAATLSGIALLPLLGMALAAAVALGSILPLVRRRLLRAPLTLWGTALAHAGVALAVFGMSADSAFTAERLVALRTGEQTSVGPWRVALVNVEPVAGPNWIAMSARLAVAYGAGEPTIIEPQARSFWAPAQQTSESALLTRWNGQLYAVVGGQAAGEGDGRWQLRLWWKPFVTCIWYGGGLIALGGLLALIGHLVTDLRRWRKGRA